MPAAEVEVRHVLLQTMQEAHAARHVQGELERPGGVDDDAGAAVEHVVQTAVLEVLAHHHQGRGRVGAAQYWLDVRVGENPEGGEGGG